MRSLWSGRRTTWAGLLVALVFAACGGDDSGTPSPTGGAGSSGSAGTGGTGATGGASGAGGTTSSGGSAGTGGTISSGGSAGTGGASGTGGAAGTGGTSGGSAGTGGTGATGGASGAGGSVGTGGASGTGGTAGSAGAPTPDASAPQDASTRDAALPTMDSPSNGADASAEPSDGGAYNPCPAKGTECKIMPLGDSITQDVSTTQLGGYRIPLLRKARAAGQTITFVGSNATGPTMLDGMPFPRANEGHSGWVIDDPSTGLYPKIVGWMNSAKPHIITLMIGTNDVNRSIDLANAPNRLGLLIDRIVQTDPKVLLVVAQIIPSLDDTLNGRIRTYNDAIPAQVQTRASAGKHVLLVDMYSAFTKNTNFKTAYFPSGNTLHPNDAGYVVMSDVWYTAIGGLLR